MASVTEEDASVSAPPTMDDLTRKRNELIAAINVLENSAADFNRTALSFAEEIISYENAHSANAAHAVGLLEVEPKGDNAEEGDDENLISSPAPKPCEKATPSGKNSPTTTLNPEKADNSVDVNATMPTAGSGKAKTGPAKRKQATGKRVTEEEGSGSDDYIPGKRVTRKRRKTSN